VDNLFHLQHRDYSNFIVALFGLWLYRSILLPLGLVLNAVKRSRSRGRNWHCLPEMLPMAT